MNLNIKGDRNVESIDPLQKSKWAVLLVVYMNAEEWRQLFGKRKIACGWEWH